MKRNTIKNAARFVGSLAVSMVTGMLVKQNVVPSSMIEKVAVGVGSFVMSGMISEKSETYIDNEIDRVFDTIDSIKEMQEEAKPGEVVISTYDNDGEKVEEMTLKVEE